MKKFGDFGGVIRMAFVGRLRAGAHKKDHLLKLGGRLIHFPCVFRVNATQMVD